MSPPRHEPPRHDQATFAEAVAQWRLALRTEVKSTSSLPTTIFHASDPMLEVLLAETTERMLSSLPPQPAAAPGQDEGGGHQRVEVVHPAEIAALPRQLDTRGDPPLDVDDHLTAEALTVLADACLAGPTPSSLVAARLLRTRFAVDPAQALDVAAAHLRQCLRTTPRPPRDDASTHELCQRIVAAIGAALASEANAERSDA
jgi:hypothetical protein